MSKIPKVSDYKNIMDSKNYEKTRILAYELCIRNKTVKALLSKLEKIRLIIIRNYSYNKKGTKVLRNRDFNEKKLFQFVDIFNYIHKPKQDLFKMDEFVSEEVKNKRFNVNLGRRSSEEIDDLEKSFRIFEEKYYAYKNKRKDPLYYHDFILKQKQYPELIRLYNRFIELYNILENEYGLNYRDYHSKKYNYYEDVRLSKSAYRYDRGFDNQEGTVFYKTGHAVSTKLIPGFSTPRIINKNTDKNIPVDLNFANPLDELISLIKEIKDNYEEDKRLIKTESEFKNKKDILLELEKNFPKNKDKGLSMQDKWAYLFFTYDYYTYAVENNIHKSEIEIFNYIDKELYNHFDKEQLNINHRWKNESVYRTTIIPLMKKLIEEKVYLNLNDTFQK